VLPDAEDSLRLGLNRFHLASVAAGVLLAVAVNRAFPKRPTTSYSLAPGFNGCEVDKSPNPCMCDRYVTPAGQGADPAARASELLTSYSASLCKLADAAEKFSRSPVNGFEELRLYAGVLPGPINEVNTTSRKLALARLPLTFDTIAANQSSHAEELVCRLKSASKFQVETFRNNLNSLLVNIIVGWQGNGDQSTYENIRQQQASEWPKLALVLRRGCEQYRDPAAQASLTHSSQPRVR
jgi:hypothetical protein